MYNDIATYFDVGGPLRESSGSMGHALKTATKNYSKSHVGDGILDLSLPDMLMWQLYTVMGPKISVQRDGKTVDGGDYMQWVRASYAIELAAADANMKVEDVCMRVFESDDPQGAVLALIYKYLGRPVVGDESAFVTIGENAYNLFDTDYETKALNRVSEGASEAVRLLYENNVLMGIISAAPKNSVLDFIRDNIRPVVCKDGIPEDAVLFEDGVIFYGRELSKVDQLVESARKADLYITGGVKSICYIADINSDITDTSKANEVLAKDGKHINLAMVKNGMGRPRWWEKTRKQTHFEPGSDYFEFDNAFRAAEHILG